jgi:hypothetical protein
MLSMPYLLFGAMGLLFYRSYRRAVHQARAAAEQAPSQPLAAPRAEGLNPTIGDAS